jgi:hypothetical protein
MRLHKRASLIIPKLDPIRVDYSPIVNCKLRFTDDSDRRYLKQKQKM